MDLASIQFIGKCRTNYLEISRACGDEISRSDGGGGGKGRGPFTFCRPPADERADVAVKGQMGKIISHRCVRIDGVVRTKNLRKIAKFSKVERAEQLSAKVSFSLKAAN